MFHPGGGGPMHHRSFDDEVKGKVYDSKVIARLPRYLAPVKGWMIIGVVGMVLRSLSVLALPYLVGLGTDNFIQGGLETLNVIALLFVGALLAMWAGQFLETKYLAMAGQSVIYRMRTEMFDHLQSLSMSFFDRNQVGKLMSRVQNDVQQLQELLTQGIFSLVTSLLTLLGIAIIMITMNPRLALLTLTVVPVLVLVIFIWQKYARRAFTNVRKAIATVNAQLQEDVSGVRVVQSLSREDENLEQFDEVNRAHLDANVSAVKLEALMMPTVNILTGVAFAIVIIIGGYQVLDGAMRIGVLLAFLLYIQRFFEPVLELAMQYTQLQRAMASGARIFEMLDIKPDITDSPEAAVLPPVRGDVGFHNVSFAYEPGKDVLHDIDLEVKAGETVAIVGQTGSGKSSLISLITRLYEVERGSVSVDGQDIRGVTQVSLREQIGIVPQNPVLFSGSIEDNIKYGKPAAGHEDVVAAAKLVGAHAFISRLEKGYGSPVGQRGGNLSAGQRQLVCLARVILTEPHILILDEATSNVDTHTERIMQRALKQVTKERTCLTIAHRLSTVTGAGRIVVIDKGHIVEEGSHRELLKKKGLYHKMYTNLSAAVDN